MLNFVEAIFLGVIQGLTEWLPVSSSGHLVVFQELLKIDADMSFDVFLHFGTLMSVIVFFREDIFNILRDIVKLKVYSENFKTGLFIVIACIPTFFIAYFFRSMIQEIFSSVFAVAIFLFINGIILLVSSFFYGKGKVNAVNGFVSGIAQGIAIAPGISRSGFTISSLIMAGVGRKKAFRFSFLMAIPVVFGANVLNLSAASVIDWRILITGFLSSFLAGYLAILIFSRAIDKRYRLFAYYCFVVSVLLMIYLILT